jgi:RNA polymerase sigma-70 factor (ECF subfamily)
VEIRPSDAELVWAAQAGDVAALGTLLERHRSGMQAVALSLLGYSPEAQDAVQEAMLIALQRLGELREPSAVGSWLRAIVRNACRMHLRSQRAARTDLRVMPNLSSPEPLPDLALDHLALRDWVWQALEDLSEPLQVVVLLRYFSEVTTYHQIAALCGVPVGTVRSRLAQARSKLSAALLAAGPGGWDDMASLTARRQREILEWFAAAERGEFGAALAAVCSAELTLVGPEGQQERGLAPLVQAMESDYAAGVRQRSATITASRRFTIIEADLLSPPWDPHHCPPGVVWLLSMRDDRVEHIRLFHPRPRGHVES